MPRIATIVHFSLPKENMDAFLTQWRKIQEAMVRQPGFLDGILHRTLDDESPFQFVNVAHWETPEALRTALRTAAEELKAAGVDMMEVMQRLGARISQNNYVEEVTY